MVLEFFVRNFRLQEFFVWIFGFGNFFVEISASKNFFCEFFAPGFCLWNFFRPKNFFVGISGSRKIFVECLALEIFFWVLLAQGIFLREFSTLRIFCGKFWLQGMLALGIFCGNFRLQKFLCGTKKSLKTKEFFWGLLFFTSSRFFKVWFLRVIQAEQSHCLVRYNSTSSHSPYENENLIKRSKILKMTSRVIGKLFQKGITSTLQLVHPLRSELIILGSESEPGFALYVLPFPPFQKGNLFFFITIFEYCLLPSGCQVIGHARLMLCWFIFGFDFQCNGNNFCPLPGVSSGIFFFFLRAIIIIRVGETTPEKIQPQACYNRRRRHRPLNWLVFNDDKWIRKDRTKRILNRLAKNY